MKLQCLKLFIMAKKKKEFLEDLREISIVGSLKGTIRNEWRGGRIRARRLEVQSKTNGLMFLKVYFAGSVHRGCCLLKPTVTSGSNRWGISLKLSSGSGRPVGSVALLLVIRVVFCCQDNLTVRTVDWSLYFLELKMSCFVKKRI